jgi:heptaprenyl diphosphate synthase
MDSIKYMLNAGGKRLRPAFAILSSRYGCLDNEEIIPLAAGLEMIHMASLIHDDIVDGSQIRRGEPALCVLWGNNFALHSGDIFCSLAIELICSRYNADIKRLIADMTYNICKGEMEELASFLDVEQDFKSYFHRINKKTAIFMETACKAGALAAGADNYTVKAIGQYGHYLGMAYQIKDDILDYISCENRLGKPAGSDLKQGIFTLEDSNTLEDIEKNNYKTISLKDILDMPIIKVNKEIEKKIRNGAVIDKFFDADKVAIEDNDGNIISIYQVVNDKAKPYIMF